MVAIGLFDREPERDARRRQVELRKAIKHLKRAGIDELKFTPSQDQLNAIKAAIKDGIPVTFSLKIE